MNLVYLYVVVVGGSMWWGGDWWRGEQVSVVISVMDDIVMDGGVVDDGGVVVAAAGRLATGARMSTTIVLGTASALHSPTPCTYRALLSSEGMLHMSTSTT